MPAVTALRVGHGERVAVELDGAPWRTLPAGVVVRGGLRVGVELDRPRARALARELRRSEALTRAARTLARRDMSARSLDARLERAGLPPGIRVEALETLARSGALDDGRFAANRARALAARGRGNAALRWDLEQHGVAAPLVERALVELEPEETRAERIVARRGSTLATARALARQGFGEDTIERVITGVEGEAAIG